MQLQHKDKQIENNNTEKDIYEEKLEVENLKKKISELKIKVEELKTQINVVMRDKGTASANNYCLQKERSLFKNQIREQQDENFR